MGWSLTIGQIAGTSIRLHFTFLLLLAWIGIADYLAGGAAAAMGGMLAGQYGHKDLFIGVPCVLGARGVEKIIELHLDDHEKRLLDNSAKAVRELVEALKKV